MVHFATADPSGGGSLLGLIMPFVLMFAVFYFLLIRPQQKKNKQRTQMLSALEKGDRVTSIGGIHGTIVELTDDIVVLRVNDSTKLTFDRSSINAVREESSATENS